MVADVLRVRDLIQGAEEPDEALAAKAAKRLGLEERDLASVRVARRSLDARKRPPRWIVSVDVEPRDDPAVAARVDAARGAHGVGAAPAPLPPLRVAPRRSALSPLVVGLGPAGLFAALTFLEHGVVPHVVERGRPVETRARDVARFFRHGELDPESNVQFGEGGAGTFSDGKLYTRRKDPLVRLVLERLVELGAPSRILVDGKPHVGTDRLRDVLVNARSILREAGAPIDFETRVTGFALAGGRLAEVHLSDGRTLAPPATLLATGHSARDVFRALDAAGVPLEAKAFALGVRVEHPQELVDVARYGRPGRDIGRGLPPADYSLTTQAAGRGVYSFCMCPGGRVLAATSELERVVTNGMSASSRAGRRANSGIVVTVEPEDFDERDALAGVRFQERWEGRAYALGGESYRAPAQRLADFLADRAPRDEIRSTYRPGVTPARLDDTLPAFLLPALRESARAFERQMPGYASREAVLIGVESRTSSPVRIPRDASGRSPGAAGLFPVGEGAGYAGGIVTAAIDGIRAAEAALDAMGLESHATRVRRELLT